MDIKQSKKPWLVLIVVGLLMTGSMGIGTSTMGLFFSPIAADLNVGIGTISMHMTIMLLVGSIISAFIPRIYKRFKFKLVLLVSVIIATLSLALLSLADHIVWFFILGGIRGASSAMFKMVTASMIINKWFVKKHGLAISLVLAISGIGGVIVAPIFANLISSIGWQTTFLIKAILYFLVCLPALIYPFKMDPKEEGLLPYGYEEEKQVSEDKVTTESNINNKLHIIAFMKVVFLVYATFISITAAFAKHLPGFSESIGIAGGVLITSALVANILSKLVIGILSDIMNPIKATLIATAFVISGLFVLLTVSDTSILIIGAFLFGFVYALGSAGKILLAKHFFGVENFNKVYPKIVLITGITFSLSIAGIGYLYDFTGSYKVAIYIGIFGLSLGVICLFILSNKSKKLKAF